MTKNTIKCFLGLLQRDITLIEMSNILNLSYRTIKRLYKRFLNSEFQDLKISNTLQKKKSNKKDLSYEKHIIAFEIAANSCIKLQSICEKLTESSLNPEYSSSPSKVCRIYKSMDYTKKRIQISY
ncbi:hypothetical protein DMUE_2227 [Dictyocoela muelleri]|nr:hypothetical protein DMUE_2227 [Dictyocoela muelleri]